MLYVTTRDNRDPYTAYRVLNERRSPDGGFYLPFHHPKFSKEEIAALEDKTFGQCVAEVLNLLFNCRLTGWDIDFYCGRAPVRLRPLEHKILVAEAWHTTTGRFDQIAKTVTERICAEAHLVSDWMNIALRCAVWFGVYAEAKRLGIDVLDVSVISGDFTLPISAWYARHWGLPIGRIVCCCNENNAVWELLCHGQMRTDSISIPTMIPKADIAVPAALERLAYEAGGIPEAANFLNACRRGTPYCPRASMLSKLRDGLYAVVVSSQRLETTIPSVYRTHGYLITPETALAYAGLQDYRSKTGEIRPVIVWAEEDPALEETI